MEVIRPFDPNHLRHLGLGVYEAKRIADEDGAREAAVLLTHPRVIVVEGPYCPTPEGVLQWRAVKFTATAISLHRSDAVH